MQDIFDVYKKCNVDSVKPFSKYYFTKYMKKKTVYLNSLERPMLRDVTVFLMTLNKFTHFCGTHFTQK